MVEEVAEERKTPKNVPLTSAGMDYSQVFSPWCLSYPINSPFSPFFVNVGVPTFSSFDASLSNAFCCPGKSSERPDPFL